MCPDFTASHLLIRDKLKQPMPPHLFCKAVEGRTTNCKVGMKTEITFTTKATKFFFDVMQDPESTRNSFLYAAVVSFLCRIFCSKVVADAYCLQGVKYAHGQSSAFLRRILQGIVIADGHPRLWQLYRLQVFHWI